MRRGKGSRPGFTLVELLVVIAILMLLLAILSPSLRRARALMRVTACKSNLKQVGVGFTMYIGAFDGRYPYGVPVPAEIMEHPHYTTWRPNDKRGGGISPQQQFWTLAYIRETDVWLCPTDLHPDNYVWWDYDVHPDIPDGSSYMFSEQALFGVTWWRHHIFRAEQVVGPASFGLAADGWMCPNGWTWDTVDPTFETPRIDWGHHGSVNFLYADGRVALHPQEGAGLLVRTNPLHPDPLQRGWH